MEDNGLCGGSQAEAGKREREKMHILQIYILVFPVASRAADAAEEIPQYEIQICPNNKHVNETTWIK